ncbi:hypothetical protein PVT71_28640 (plasmid) [Salipiger sp. H15]|uniref:Uncharacterized protein n=1 Tax=Alloyangia sp. H15 TaxID=3029062 RepID=A0AAU8ATR2_9RHOB
MTVFDRYHPATLQDLAGWSTLSRNGVGPLLKGLGVAALNRKYPMLRVYHGLLGLDPEDDAEAQMLGQGLVRTTWVAARVGLQNDDLLKALRRPGHGYPPLFVLGPHRHLMLRAQVEQMLASPRNAWHALTPIAGFAEPASHLARATGRPQARIDALLADAETAPMHILAGGQSRFLVADVLRRLGSPAAPDSGASAAVAAEDGPERDAPCPPVAAPVGGLFASATRQAPRDHPARSVCTRSAAGARRGDDAHGAPAEAKLPKT